ncbi:Toxin CcdB (plasmid) [Sulfitobacter sp. DSM 110093]|uniref:CcdB family protein n=1 Tax=Sulfitobacter sp. DSM 110093 TaxID=2883127 RepID=UPI001FADB864|nr:CcdB family protein [Sulfitobacter sp. DSM 110093]UOA34066.1 Toxin CcdB [Sulfitobacter sp. DSM 110093]
MPKYDVFPNPSGDGYLLDVQTDLLSDLNTRMVVPLLPTSSAPKSATRLNPVFDFEDQQVVMVTQFMAAVPAGILRVSIGKLDEEFEKVTSAIDMLFQGF